MPKYSLETIANWLKIELDGKQNLDISSLAAIEQANDSQLSFLSNPKYEKHLYESNAAAVLVKKDFEASRAVKPVLLKVDDPYLAFAILLHRFYIPEEINEAIHPNASIAETAIVETAVKIGAYTIIKDQVRVGANSQIFDQVYLGANVTIGKDCIIYPGVKIYRDCHVGNGTIIHSGTVIGSDGFGFAPQSNTYQKIPQTGNVIIGSKVEIGANCAIDRATVGSTIIEDGVKLDNLIQVAHNVKIAKNTVIAAQTGVSGSTEIGENCIVGGQAGFVGHIKIANGSKINAKSGIAKSIVEENMAWSGTPARAFREAYKVQAYQQRLPDMAAELKQLKAEMADLKASLKK